MAELTNQNEELHSERMNNGKLAQEVDQMNQEKQAFFLISNDVTSKLLSI